MEGRGFDSAIGAVMGREGLVPTPSDAVTLRGETRSVTIETTPLFSIEPSRRGLVYSVRTPGEPLRQALLVINQVPGGMRLRILLVSSGEKLLEEEFTWRAEQHDGPTHPPDAQYRSGWLGFSYSFSEDETKLLTARVGAAAGFSAVIGVVSAMLPGGQPIAAIAAAAALLLAAGVAILQWIDSEGRNQGIFWGQTWALVGWLWHNPPPRLVAK